MNLHTIGVELYTIIIRRSTILQLHYTYIHVQTNQTGPHATLPRSTNPRGQSTTWQAMLRDDALWEWWQSQPASSPARSPAKADDPGREELFMAMYEKVHNNPELVGITNHRHARTDLTPYNDGSALMAMNASPQPFRFAAQKRHDMGISDWRQGDVGALTLDGSDAAHPIRENLDQMSGWRAGDNEAFSFGSEAYSNLKPGVRPKGRPRSNELLPFTGDSPAAMAVALQNMQLRADPEGAVLSSGGAPVVISHAEARSEEVYLGSSSAMQSGRRHHRADDAAAEIGFRTQAPPRGFSSDAAAGTHSPTVRHSRQATDATDSLRPKVLADPNYAPPTANYNRSSWRLGETRSGGAASGQHVRTIDGANLTEHTSAAELAQQYPGKHPSWERREYDTTRANHLHATQALDGSTPPPQPQRPSPQPPPQVSPLRGKLTQPTVVYGRGGSDVNAEYIQRIEKPMQPNQRLVDTSTRRVSMDYVTRVSRSDAQRNIMEQVKSNTS